MIGALRSLACVTLAAAAMASLATYAASAQQPHATDAELLPIGVTFTIDSRVLGETRRINVYVPTEYADSDAQRLPVLYMPDGGIHEDFLHIAGLLQVSAMNGTARPFLLVGIESTQRRRDLTGPTDDPADRRIAPQVGGSADFRAFIRSELMPLIGARYRVTDERAIIGESLAGLFVVETFVVEPDLFDTYIAIDPSLWWNRGQLLEDAPARLRAAHDARRLYLASSSEAELAAQAARLVGALRGRGGSIERWQHVPHPHETHATVFHPAAMAAVRSLFSTAGR